MSAQRSPDPFAEPVEAAKAAALRYVSDSVPGLRRRRAGSGFSYLGPDGKTVRDAATLARIRALAIPPAWREVWICPLAQGHLQATGRDAKGRKQYRYHQRWRQVRDETKYERTLQFAATLPRIRARVRKDLALQGLPRDKVLAIVVRLLERSFIRVGNEEYARANRSYGLTTMRDRHVEIAGGTLRFRFQGKSGKSHTIDLNDRRLARLVKHCRELPGQEVFQYLDEAGEVQPVDSGAVNDYLGGIAGQDFTAKDFRTWAGTLLAARQLGGVDAPESERQARTALVEAAETVAQALGNTASICRKCYIHPTVLAAFQNRALHQRWLTASGRKTARPGLSREESALLAFLRDNSGRSLESLLKESLRPPRRGATARR